MDAVVVGSGPNGLTAAIVLAEAGHTVTMLEAKSTIGGGTRTEELTLPGFRHDVCSAFHPLGVASPAFATFPLHEHGLGWILPEVQVAHPLDDGSAAGLWHSLETTLEHMNDRTARRWKRTISPILDNWPAASEMLLRPLLRFPDPRTAVRVAPLIRPASWVMRGEPRGRALFAGIAAHSSQPLTSLATSGTGVLLAALAHLGGWPVAKGGSAAITNALASYFQSLGGTIITDRPVESPKDVARADLVFYNTTPQALESIYGNALPRRMRRWIRRFKPGVGAYKIDYALSAPIPWVSDVCRRAGTVHVGGTAEEIIAAEQSVANGVNPDRPFVLVGQQSLVDPSRAPEGHHTAWAYTHVPNGYRGSATRSMEAQIERFAPGFSDVVLARNILGTHDLQDHNPNYLGGDIGAGAMTLRQTVARPRLSAHPYRTALPGVYLCSASTPPGPGVHGMAGFHAAHAALRDRDFA
jgi:phytoene dehydrogenase-like protein